MGNEAVTNFTWVIKNFSSLQSKFIYSDQFVANGCKWRVLVYPKGDKDNNYLSLYLVVSGYKKLPCGWKRHARYSLSIVNQVSETLFIRKEKQEWFDRLNPFSGFKTMIPLARLHDKDGGFLVNDQVKILVEVEVGKVIGNLDGLAESQTLKKIKLNDDDVVGSKEFVKVSPSVSIDDNGSQVLPSQVEFVSHYDKDDGVSVKNEVKTVESQEVTQPLRKTKLNDDGDGQESKDLVKKISSVTESIDVNGFQVLPSQVEFVSLVFKRYPEIAIELRAKNESLRTAGMYVFISLIKILCKSLEEFSNDDLMQGENGLTYLKCLGIKVDWLELKLEEVKEKKKQNVIGETRVQELEEELNGVKENCSAIEALLETKKEELREFRQKWSEIEALLEEEKANVLVARAPVLTLDEVV